MGNSIEISRVGGTLNESKSKHSRVQYLKDLLKNLLFKKEPFLDVSF